MKRGQLSLFLIVAAIILIILLVTVNVVRRLAPHTTESTFPVNSNDTTLCLTDATTSALFTVLAEGGVNYDSTPLNAPRQNEWGSGLAPSYVTDAGEMGRIAPTPYFSIPSTTPGAQERVLVGVQRGPYRGAQLPAPFVPSITTPWFGNRSLDALCSRTGANKPNADGTGANTCLPGTYHIVPRERASIQEGLEQRITAILQQNADTCPALQQRVQVTLGDSDVTVEAGTTVVRVPVRLKALYYAAWGFANAEITDPTFALRPPVGQTAPWQPPITQCPAWYNGGNCLVNGLSVQTQSYPDECEALDAGPCATTPPEPTGFAQPITVVTITDTARRFDGQYPALRFAVRNRYPLLASEHAITQGTVPQFATTVTCTGVERISATEKPYTLPLGLDADDVPFWVAVRAETSTATGTSYTTVANAFTTTDNTDVTTATGTCDGACELTLDCGALEPFNDPVLGAEDVTFHAIFCSRNPDATTAPDLEQLFDFSYPDGLPSASWPRDCQRVAFTVES